MFSQNIGWASNAHPLPIRFHCPCVDTGFTCIAGPQPNNSRCLRLITTECARDHKGDCFGKQSDTEIFTSNSSLEKQISNLKLERCRLNEQFIVLIFF